MGDAVLVNPFESFAIRQLWRERMDPEEPIGVVTRVRPDGTRDVVLTPKAAEIFAGVMGFDAHMESVEGPWPLGGLIPTSDFTAEENWDDE